MISARALGVLHRLHTIKEQQSAVELAEYFKEGKHAMRASLVELESLGLIERKTVRIGTRYVHTQKVTDEGRAYLGFSEPEIGSPKIRPLIQLNNLNNSLDTNNSFSVITLKSNSHEVRKEKTMGYEFFKKNSSLDDEEFEAARLKAEKERQVEYREQKMLASAKTAEIKANRQPKDWSVKDSVHEFADRMSMTWGIPPWNFAETPFFQAFGKSRKKYMTKGDVEIEMINIFYSNLKITRGLTTGDLLWKQFIAQYATLAEQAKLRLSTPQQIEQALQESEDSWKGL